LDLLKEKQSESQLPFALKIKFSMRDLASSRVFEQFEIPFAQRATTEKTTRDMSGKNFVVIPHDERKEPQARGCGSP
jgi:hypothetical protein